MEGTIAKTQAGIAAKFSAVPSRHRVGLKNGRLWILTAEECAKRDETGELPVGFVYGRDLNSDVGWLKAFLELDALGLYRRGKWSKFAKSRVDLSSVHPDDLNGRYSELQPSEPYGNDEDSVDDLTEDDTEPQTFERIYTGFGVVVSADHSVQYLDLAGHWICGFNWHCNLE